MEENKDTHKTILKATGIFGFAQILKIFIGIIGSKFIAIFIGPIGIATVGLINSAINIISSITNFGFNITSVREIALAKAEYDEEKLSESLFLMHRLAIIIGLVGGLISIVFSTVLSQFTFGSSRYYYWFIILAVYFVFSSLTASKSAIMQGFRMTKAIAFSNVVTSVLVVCFTIPIYYFYRLDGIIPVLILSSIISLIVNYYFARNIKIPKLKLTLSESFHKSKSVITMGYLLSINIIFGYLCTYIIKIYLSHNGSTPEILGFYEVSVVILLSYVGLIFNAMGTDFYPRLTSIQNDTNKVNQLVNDQIEIGLLLCTPLIVLFYLLSPYIIKLLYSEAFLDVLLIFKAGLLAIIVKVIIWPLAFIVLAKGDKKLYFRQEIVGDLFNIGFTILFFYLFGLTGIGMATLLNYSLFGIIIYYILHSKYNFCIRKNTFKLILVSLSLGIASCLIVFYVTYPKAHFYIAIVAIFSIIYSYIELNKRIDFKDIIKRKLNKF